MQIAMLGSPTSWYFKDLRRAAGSDHQVWAVSFSHLAAAVGDDLPCCWSGDSKLDEFDAVLVRTMPAGSLEQVVFRMDVLGQLEAAGKTVVNPPRAIEAAVDKYLGLSRLRAAGLATPPTIACHTVDDAMLGFETLCGDVVAKPLFGSEGRGMTRVTDPNVALRVFKALAQLNSVIYIQQFIEHEGYDIRLLVLGEQVFAMKRVNSRDWRTNVSQGASTETYEANDQIVQIARSAAHAVGAAFAGVDVLPSRDGRHYVLEVNAVPGWKALARTLQADISAQVIAFLEELATR